MHSKGNTKLLFQILNSNTFDEPKSLWYKLSDDQMNEEVVGNFSFIVIENNLKVIHLSKGAELTFDEYEPINSV